MAKLLPKADYSQKLKALRERKFENQAAFVRALGRKQTEVSRWERGRVRPNYDTTVLIAETLGVPVSEFLMPAEPKANGNARTRADDHDQDVDIRRRLDAIEASSLDETLKIVKMESLAAIVRAEQARYEARAAAIRARAIDRAEGAAEIRARAIDRAEENALRRFLALGNEITPESEEQLRNLMRRMVKEEVSGDPTKAGESPA